MLFDFCFDRHYPVEHYCNILFCIQFGRIGPASSNRVLRSVSSLSPDNASPTNTDTEFPSIVGGNTDDIVHANFVSPPGFSSNSCEDVYEDAKKRAKENVSKMMKTYNIVSFLSPNDIIAPEEPSEKCEADSVEIITDKILIEFNKECHNVNAESPSQKHSNEANDTPLEMKKSDRLNTKRKMRKLERKRTHLIRTIDIRLYRLINLVVFIYFNFFS